MYREAYPSQCNISDFRSPSVFMNISSQTIRIEWFTSLTDNWYRIIMGPPNGGVITFIEMVYQSSTGREIRGDITHATPVTLTNKGIKPEGYENPYKPKELINPANFKKCTLDYSLNVFPHRGSAFISPAVLRVIEPTGNITDFDMTKGGIVEYDEHFRARRTS